jgi:hypothetical protein
MFAEALVRGDFIAYLHGMGSERLRIGADEPESTGRTRPRLGSPDATPKAKGSVDTLRA